MTQHIENGTLIFAATILFVLTLVAGTVPVMLIEFVSKRIKSKSNSPTFTTQSTDQTNSFSSKLKAIFVKDRIVNFLAQLGGGVLLYTSLIHMLPEIREDYEEYKKNKNETVIQHEESGDLPMVDLCALAGFFCIFLVEELMHTFFLKNHDHHHGDSTSSGEHSKSPKNHSLSRRLSMRQYMQTRKHYHPHINEKEGSVPQQQQNCSGNSGHCYKNGQAMMVLTETAPISICQPSCYDACEQSDMAIDSNGIVSKCDVENISNFETIINEDKTIFARILDALLMILAFSVHAVFDGISIGVQSGSRVWTVLIAILTHKLLIAFILSVQIYEKCFQKVKTPSEPGGALQRKPMKRAKPILWVFSTIFAIMSPMGIIIVLVMGQNSGSQDKPMHLILLAAFSAGTIIYICFLEIIDKSSSRTHISGFVQWVALLLGFGLMHLVSVLFHE